MPCSRCRPEKGIGLVYLEAMRAGLSCIGGTEDAARDVIAEGETGILVNTSNRRAIAESVVRMLADPATRAAHGAAGGKCFEPEITFNQYFARLSGVLATTFA